LEARQLLHGGGLGVEARPVEDRSAAIFDRLDVNDDNTINAEDGLADRIWEKVSAADGALEGSEADGNVDAEELSAHFEASEADRDRGNRQKGRRAVRGRKPGRVDRADTDVNTMVDKFFAAKDAVVEGTDAGDGLLTEEELGRHAERLAGADLDGNGIDRGELTAFIEGKIEERNERKDAVAEGNDDSGEVAAARRGAEGRPDDGPVGRRRVDRRTGPRRSGPRADQPTGPSEDGPASPNADGPTGPSKDGPTGRSGRVGSRGPRSIGRS